VAEIENLFKHDDKLRLDLFWDDPDNETKVFYVEDPPDLASPGKRHLEEDLEYTSGHHGQFETMATNVFALHSRPSSNKVIYLDFNGHNITGTAWNDKNGYILAPAFSTDSVPSTFSTSEQAIINEVWQRVSEDFAPFDVDVTTEYPGNEDFLTRSNDTDLNYGVRVLISPISSILCSGCAGLSYVSVFGSVGKKPFKFSSL
jgi:hypothetical protein